MRIRPSKRAKRLPVLSSALASLLPGAFVVEQVYAHEATAPQVAPDWNDVEFDATFLKDSRTNIDMRRFARPNSVEPGTYKVDIFVNEVLAFRADVEFKASEGRSAVPHVTRQMLERAGIDFSKVEAVNPAATQDDNGLAEIQTFVPGATVSFDAGEARLSIVVPQAQVKRQLRGEVDRSLWRSGSPAAYLGHHSNLLVSRDHGRSDSSLFSGISAGASLGQWSVRHHGSLHAREGVGVHYRSHATTLNRDLPALAAQLSVGEVFTDASLFDSVRLRGIRVASDERMLPQSQVGFAPTIRGTAVTNSRVEILQRGAVIYETTVTPGPYEINDLYDSGAGGDLEVRVTDADGARSTYRVPFSPGANVLRPGATRFTAALGVADENPDHPWLIQGAYRRGFSNAFTGYLGGVAAEGYHSTLAGIGINTAFGAASLDLTRASSRHAGRTEEGQSAQLRFARAFGERTSVSVAAARYNSSGYVGVSEHLRRRASGQDAIVASSDGFHDTRIKSRVDLQVSHSTGTGSLFTTASRSEDRAGDSSLSFSAGYSTTWRGAGISFTAQRGITRSGSMPARQDTTLQATVSIRLGKQPRSPFLTANSSTGRQHRAQHSIGMTGNLGRDNQISYGLSGNVGSYRGIGANVGIQNHLGQYAASYSAAGGRQTFSASAASGVVLHRGGVTHAARVSETMAIVRADGATGARVGGASDARINRKGYAVVSNMSPYRWNTVNVDPLGMPLDVELKNSSQTVAPRHGAIVPIDFETRSGQAILMTLVDSEGEALAFGSEVINQDEQIVGMVGQSGQAFVRAAPTDLLSVRLADGGVCELPAERNAQASGIMNRGMQQCMPVAKPLARTMQ